MFILKFCPWTPLALPQAVAPNSAHVYYATNTTITTTTTTTTMTHLR